MSEGTVQGTIHVIEETKSYGQNGFRKRLVVLEQETGRFTNYVPLEFLQDACDSVDELNVGEKVEIRYRLNGRKWQKDANSEVKFFLSCEATNYRVLSGQSAAADEFTEDPNDAFNQAAYEDDDEVPF